LKYFTEQDIQIGIEYSRRGFEIKIISEIIQFFLLITLLFTNLNHKLEELLSRKFENSFWKIVLSYLAILYTILFLIKLPFSFYFGYVLEHQFGFSNLNLLNWFIFKFKVFLLSLSSICFFGYLLLTIIKKFPKLWLSIIPILSLIFSLLFSILFPILITPLFYKFHPIEEGELKSKIIQLSNKANISIESIYVIEESEYSKHTNAYFTGFGENKKIFLYDTLLKNHTLDEIISVLGHEIGHWKESHQLKDILYNSLELFLVTQILYFSFQFAKRKSFPLNEIHSPSSVVFLFTIYNLYGNLNQPIWSKLSRTQETEADIEALVLTKDKKSFIDTEIKMARDNKTRLNPHPIVETYYYSHPKTIDRIQLAEDFQ
jgi:STE24 endopeptidase